MSLSDIRTEIKFGISVGINRDEIAFSKGDIIKWKQERQAQDFGILVMKEKGWREMSWEHPDMLIFDQNLYIFTPNELRDFLDAKIKEKLVQMSQRDTEKDISDRLVMLSERV